MRIHKIARLTGLAAATVVLGLLAGCGGSDLGGGTVIDDNGNIDAGSSSLEVNNCDLLTNQEVSALAGTELVASEDSPLGCPYAEPGEIMGLFSIRSYRQEGDAATAATELAPDLQVIPMPGVGEDAVALADSDGSVNFLIARQGDLYVELVMTFLDVEPDSASLTQAGQLASTALGRLVDAA